MHLTEKCESCLTNVLFLYSDVNARLIVFFIVSDIANLYRDNKTGIYIAQYSLTSEFTNSFKACINRSVIKFIIINVIKYDEYLVIHVNLFSLSNFFFFLLGTVERKKVSNLFKFNIFVFDFSSYIYIIFQYVTILVTSTG